MSNKRKEQAIMEDRFRFRGQAKNVEWVYGSLLWYADEPQIWDKDGYNFIVNAETIGQCTGLKDINGRLIYEGDILRVNTGSRNTSGYGVVEYNQSGCGFVVSGFLENPNPIRPFPSKKGEFYQKLQEWLCTEVIGNIYENPELLEVPNAEEKP